VRTNSRSVDSHSRGFVSRVARFFWPPHTKTLKTYVHLMTTKYTNIIHFKAIQNIPKNGIFCRKICHLATRVCSTCAIRSRIHWRKTNRNNFLNIEDLSCFERRKQEPLNFEQTRLLLLTSSFGLSEISKVKMSNAICPVFYSSCLQWTLSELQWRSIESSARRIFSDKPLNTGRTIHMRPSGISIKFNK
jgi:hypothetical protein